LCVVTLDVADVDALFRGDKLSPSMDAIFRKEIVGFRLILFLLD